jgi:hypothetical protein
MKLKVEFDIDVQGERPDDDVLMFNAVTGHFESESISVSVDTATLFIESATVVECDGEDVTA